MEGKKSASKEGAQPAVQKDKGRNNLLLYFTKSTQSSSNAKQTLTKQKIQTELQKKKNKKYTSVLNREFKKEMYYQPKLGYVGEPTADDDTRK